ncbi:MAG: glucoamylase family protein [Gemmatimonadales bacterium]
MRGAGQEAFSVVVGNLDALRGLRYVITLDADTVLPPDAAPDLVGAIAHPLNRAQYDPERGRVVRGYGILQPRVGVSLPSAYRSRFAAAYSGRPGVDPYTTAVSDVYQDLYGEGSFTGKGIYDLDAFEQATHGRFPENRLLSHDLIEGNYARTGLLTDVNIYDDYPTGYLTYTRRKHRWIRGDWQLLQWLTATVPGPDGPEPNRLSMLSRWKIFDNLRRSVIEVAQLAFLVAGWTILPGSPLRWTLLGLAAIAVPWIVATALALLRPPLGKSLRAYYGAVGLDAIRSAGQLGLAIVFLPHQAWVSADAVARTLWRLFVSRRHLLEWQTASRAEQVTSDTRRATWRAMLPAVGLVAVIAALVGYRLATSGDPGLVWSLGLGAVPLLVAWALSPVVASALGSPVVRPGRRLPPASRRQALRYALLHWRFFERFVGPETHWLAPDNFQEDPAPVTALRTSPTNIGLQLLATVSAHDLGLIHLEEMIVRLERVFSTLDRMPRFRGHFYNWYALGDLSVLQPAYVSTVDSGNLAGHLIAIRQACLTLPDEPPAPGRVRDALAAALGMVEAQLERLGDSRAGPVTKTRDGLAAARTQLGLARAALRSAGDEADPDAVVGGLVAPLSRALDLIATTELPGEETEPASAWIRWALRLIAARPAGGGRPDTLRQRAARSEADRALVTRLEVIAELARGYTAQMEFGFLLDPERKLLSIGYQLANHSLDAASYDLLASEARLASFVAIAKNDVPVEHWFRLGRTLTYASGAPAMVSWSGSMFEYLMPSLVMQSFPFTLLDQTYRGALRRQIAYGAARGVPWGFSESAYNGRDRHFTYQYRAFGVPDLALKRGLARDLVVAPYASLLAIMVDPERALHNLSAIERLAALGRFGFYDAIDYTRPAPESDHALVRNYMAHHVGMSLVALTNALAEGIWQRRFHADPVVRSAELLLHERIPQRLLLREARAAADGDARSTPVFAGPAVRELESTQTSKPHVALLGRPPFTVMVSHCGGGYSRYQDLAVSRWRADGTKDDTGQFCYLKDLSRGRVWSAAHQPVCAPADWYRATLAADRVTFHRTDGEIETRTEIAVVPEDAAEVRRVFLTNNGTEAREIELTSYGELVLAPPDADDAHPAFGNLFVETEWHEWCTAITAVRRPRSPSDPMLWCVHVVDTGQERVGPVSCETDRARFQGRGRSLRDPVALEEDGPLAGTTGAVLDPIFALRTRVRIDPGASASVTFTTLVATSRERAFELAGRYHDPHAAQRALDLAWTSSQLELRELGLTPADATVFQELAGHVFFGNPAARAPAAELRQNRGSQPRLWAHGISGDWPIVLATITTAEGIATLRQVLAAHQYWRRRGLVVDLVVLNAHPTTYQAELEAEISAAIADLSPVGTLDRPGGVFLRRRDHLEAPDLLMIRATARVLIPCDSRSLGRIVQAMRSEPEPGGDDLGPLPSQPRRAERSSALLEDHPWRLPPESPVQPDPTGESGGAHGADRGPGVGTAPGFDNGLGGLTPDGAYEIRVAGDRLPPAPWVNVIANPHGGFIVSERGAGFTWAENSYFFRLTPWHNDPVGDPPTEVIYLRDAASGELWCPTPAPVRTASPYTVRHAPGSSTFRHQHRGIATRLRLGMAPDRAVKCAVLELTNLGSAPRRLTMTAFAEWTLGVRRERTQSHVLTRFEPESGAIFARNSFDPQYAEWVGFHAISEPVTSHTGDRREFLGQNGHLGAPEALARLAADGGSLSDTTGAGMDPCSALQCELELAASETRRIVVLLGATPDATRARQAIADCLAPARAVAAIAASAVAWDTRLSQITVRTPDPAFDAIQNRWSLYQALGCRMWARSALYQSSGAYGFRDQLQDVMAFVYAEPGIAREHILRSAARQFLEGDVQHWWHPETGRGVRTRFSDDLVWLPYVVDHYVRVTGDRSVLDESVPFLRMRELRPDEHEVYDLPEVAAERATVHEHCVRALRRAATAGAHGLPLIGGGDWNDGMNRVGSEGRGESVWLAWFLITTLRSYAAQAEHHGDVSVADEFRAQADRYAEAVEAHGWDGAWYRRAYFDDGTALGSRANDECRIDSLAQSWSVISGAGDPKRQEWAMQAVERYLVRDDARLIQLLDPPFDSTPHDPGYIRGYLPGVRENGAQYTHAALWVVLATALRGDGDRAFELYQMLNPLTHTRTPAEVETYKVEPYVIAADVYTARGRLGQGGWTWYTGSASWMYRVGLESILGLTKRGDTLSFKPAVPARWAEFSLVYRHGGSSYSILVRHPARVTPDLAEVVLDGRRLDGASIPLVDDGGRHEVVVTGLADPTSAGTSARVQGGPVRPE